MNPLQTFKECVTKAVPKALKTSWWLIKITIPVAFMVFLLNRTGVVAVVSDFLLPIFQFVGLPGETALILLTSALTNVYSVVVVLSTLALDFRDTIILAVMCLITHALIPETIIQKKVGSSAITMVLLRIAMSLLVGIVLNFVLPEFNRSIVGIVQDHDAPFVQELINWSISMFYLSAKIVGLITGLLILQHILEAFGLIVWLSKLFRPVILALGLPESTTLSWLIANLIGLSYGSAVLLEQVESGKMSKKEADLLNHHIAISHSQLEDPLLFLPLGLPIVWLIVPRVLIAVVVVWVKRLFDFYQKKKTSLPSLKPKAVSN